MDVLYVLGLALAIFVGAAIFTLIAGFLMDVYMSLLKRYMSEGWALAIFTLTIMVPLCLLLAMSIMGY